MKINTFCGHLVPLLRLPMSDFTELQRALKEQSAHFDPENELNASVHRYAETAGVGFDPNLLKGKAGPGGGIEMDSFRAAFFVLAVALNGPRKESATATWQTWHLNQEGSILSGMGEDFQGHFAICPLTKQHLFGEALKAIIEDVELAERVKEVRVASNRTAEIRYDAESISKFEKPHSEYTPLYRVAVVDGRVWRQIARLIESGR